MRVKYLGHSGFAVETETAFYIFDYIKGKLPKNCRKNETKPVYIFVSHFHADHFEADIFDIKDRIPNVKYILSKDTIKKIKKTKRFALRSEGCDITMALPDESIDLGNASVRMLNSTDEGVAYIVNDPEGVIYHAGDLNWWDWPGEDPNWNKQMANNFKKEISKIENDEIDVAFIPLDPRQEESYWLGMQYFLEHVAVKKVYPMHFWEQPEIIEKYISEHGKDKKKCETEIMNEF